MRNESAAIIPETPRRFDFRRLLPPSLSRPALEQHLDVSSIQALQAALARESNLLREKDTLLIEQELLRSESDHRLMNGLQMVVSLLSLQSRAAPTPEIAAQLTIAANRVATVERVHRRLHFNDGTKSVALKKYLEDFCNDFSGMTLPGSEKSLALRVEGDEIEIPTATAIPLGFIANELITNAVKYGKGQIIVDLKTNSDGRNAMSVTNDGPALPANYDPAASNGLGMKIVRALIQKIDGEFDFGEGHNNAGARFVVHFS